MSTFIKMIPLELDEIKEYREPGMALEGTDHIIGDMSDTLKKLWTLWKQVQYSAAELGIKLQCGEQDISQAKICEMEAKSEVLRALFWIAVADEFDVWDKGHLGVRQGYKVVWSDKPPEGMLPPFFRQIFGGEL